ncbi:P-loop containing nucleoside triphosphate hydrolase protein [Boletus reticuloceps]|uniref:ATP-dependent RNA helicase n=1 Tax=Boletus reticuloceps TaxID=495285 RepID=A0A8I2YW26_9AGAM|nr:P-loop containing nucleoside triphosphate hydrolase protein [Boletus reticuloceps]
MLTRLLVRWPRLSPIAVHAHARAFRATSLARAPNVAALLKPELAPAAPAYEPQVDQSTNRAHFSSTRFADAPISDRSKMAIPHEYARFICRYSASNCRCANSILEATLELGLSGVDLLVQAKTGTGKTMAFLLPAIERLAKKPPRGGAVSILVLSPTRELAMQIQKEANTLVKNHPFRVQVLIGGTSIGMQKKRLNTHRSDILVATPGRLLDLLGSTDLAEKLHSIQAIVLDEADRLLDVGFKDTLNSIFRHLPDRDQNPRQCMLYSATLSKDVKQITALYLTPDYKFVSTLAEDEINTHEHGNAALHCNLSRLLSPVLRDDVAEHGNNSKSMVFCTTAWGTSATAKLLEDAGHGTLPPVYEIHSRMTQNRRLAVAQDFKRARSGILVTSDVTARGMDFPGVTLVVQVGLPSSGEQYIHRLGRTARAGRSGKGVIILAPHESGFLRTPDMRALPIQPHPELQLPSIPRPVLDRTLQIQAYSAWLGFNAQYVRQIFRSRQQYVNEANKYAREVLGWADESQAPPLSPTTARNLGIHGLDGVNTGSHAFGRDGHQRSSSRSPSRKSSWQGEDNVPDGGFRRFQRQDTREQSSNRRSDFGSSRPPRRNGGWVRREQSWGGSS